MAIADDDYAKTRFERIISFRLHVLVNLNERGATMLYSRKFGISLNEWRVIALLGDCESLTLNQIAHRVDLDKSQASRIAATLVKRKLLSRQANKDDARSVTLKLTPAGQDAFERLFAEEAVQRQERLLSCLTEEERIHLESAVDKLTAQARLMYQEEKEAARETRFAPAIGTSGHEAPQTAES